MIPSRRQPSSVESLLVTVFQQHWEHARHVENERLAITGAYVALLTATLAYFSTRKLDVEALPLLLFLCCVSLVGLSLCMKLYVIFNAHTQAAEALLARHKLPSMLAPIDRFPISRARLLGVGALFAAIYQLGLAFFAYLALVAATDSWRIGLATALISFTAAAWWSRKATRPGNEA